MSNYMVDPLGDEVLDAWSNPMLKRIGQQPMRAKLAALATLAQTASVSGLDPNTLALWADYSHWNGTLDLTKTQPWLSGIMTKMSDGKQIYKGSGTDLSNYKDKTFNTNVQKAYDVGIPCIPYHYFQNIIVPGWKLDHVYKHQYDVIKASIRGLKPGISYHALAIDIEERDDTSTNVRAKVEGLYNLLMDDPEFAGIPIIFYTSMSILNLYPALRDWLSYQGANKNLWMAQWAFSGRKNVTWEQLYSEYVGKMNTRVMTPGYADWRFYQWSANFIVPGCTENYTDLNFYKGTRQASYDWLGYKKAAVPTPPPVVVEPPAETKALEARVAALETKITALRGDVAALTAEYDQHGHPIGAPAKR